MQKHVKEKRRHLRENVRLKLPYFKPDVEDACENETHVILLMVTLSFWKQLIPIYKQKLPRAPVTAKKVNRFEPSLETSG